MALVPQRASMLRRRGMGITFNDAGFAAQNPTYCYFAKYLDSRCTPPVTVPPQSLPPTGPPSGYDPRTGTVNPDNTTGDTTSPFPFQPFGAPRPGQAPNAPDAPCEEGFLCCVLGIGCQSGQTSTPWMTIALVSVGAVFVLGFIGGRR